MKFYLENRVLAGFVLALVILSWLGYYSYSNNQDLIGTNRMIAHTNEVLYHIEQSHSVVFELEMMLMKYIVSGDTVFLASYKKQLQEGAKHLQKVRELARDNPAQQLNIDTLSQDISKKVQYNRLVIQAMQESKEAAQKLMPSSKNAILQRNVVEILEKIKGNEKILLSKRIEEGERNYAKFNLAFSSLLTAIAAILILLFISINKSLYARMMAVQQTQQLNKELEAFTYSVSHDLRAPLRSVDGYSKVLLEDYGANLDEEGQRTIKVIIGNAKKMGQLIDDLLEFSRIGKKEIIKSSLNMQTLIETALKEQERTGNVEIKLGDLISARGDQSMIYQVWLNLISNAVKYSKKVDRPIIEFQSFKKDDHVVYSITDNGVGFDMQYAHKLFGVFQRLHKAKDFEGTGVGLALVQRIIQKHNGHVWAKAEINKGATFYFSLPV